MVLEPRETIEPREAARGRGASAAARVHGKGGERGRDDRQILDRNVGKPVEKLVKRRLSLSEWLIWKKKILISQCMT